MQVLLTSAIPKVANENGIPNCSLAWAILILAGLRKAVIFSSDNRLFGLLQPLWLPIHPRFTSIEGWDAENLLDVLMQGANHCDDGFIAVYTHLSDKLIN